MDSPESKSPEIIWFAGLWFCLTDTQQRRRDSNPRSARSEQRFSRPPHSTALPLLYYLFLNPKSSILNPKILPPLQTIASDCYPPADFSSAYAQRTLFKRNSGNRTAKLNLKSRFTNPMRQIARRISPLFLSEIRKGLLDILCSIPRGRLARI